MSKKTIILITLLAVCMLLPISVYAQEKQDVSIVKEGSTNLYYGKIVDERLIIPLTYLADLLKLKVTWYPDGRVNLNINSQEIKFRMGNTSITCSGEELTSDIAPQVLANVQYVPLRLFCEKLGYTVDWDSVDRNAVVR